MNLDRLRQTISKNIAKISIRLKRINMSSMICSDNTPKFLIPPLTKNYQKNSLNPKSKLFMKISKKTIRNMILNPTLWELQTFYFLLLIIKSSNKLCLITMKEILKEKLKRPHIISWKVISLKKNSILYTKKIFLNGIKF